MGKAFTSNEELFGAVRAFADQLDAQGHVSVAAEIKHSFSCLNGLTDGWALFGAALEDVRARHGGEFTAKQQAELKEFIAVVDGVVHRR